MNEHLAVAARGVPRRAVLDLDRHMYRARATERLLDRHLDLGGVFSLLFNMAPDVSNYRACDNAGHEGDKDGAKRRTASRIFLTRQIGTDVVGEALGTLRGHVENTEGCRAVGVDVMARLRVFAGEMDMSAGSPSVAVASALASSASAWAKLVRRSGARQDRRAASESAATSLPVSSSSLDTSRGVGSSHPSSGAAHSLYHHSKLSISIRGAP